GMASRSAAYAIVPTDASCPTAGAPGPRFSGVASQTGGGTLSVCAQDYSAFLDPIAAKAAGPQRAFQLAHTPFSPPSFQVTVDGAAKSSPADWSYDTAANAVVFTAA